MRRRQIVVGTFYIGREQCQLVLRDGNGAEFYLTPEDGALPRIKVGADDADWAGLVSRLLHEAMEFAIERARCRFERCANTDQGGYVFVLDHAAFTECCERVGEFIACALPSLANSWKKWRKTRARMTAADGKTLEVAT